MLKQLLWGLIFISSEKKDATDDSLFPSENVMLYLPKPHSVLLNILPLQCCIWKGSKAASLKFVWTNCVEFLFSQLDLYWTHVGLVWWPWMAAVQHCNCPWQSESVLLLEMETCIVLAMSICSVGWTMLGWDKAANEHRLNKMVLLIL